jgi:hypothetical protein
LTKQDNRSVYNRRIVLFCEKPMSTPQSLAMAEATNPGPSLSGTRRESAAPVVELRQYTLRPGGRDTLIGLFDTHFVEPQEEAGITVIGQFRDVDRPDMFVWLRGFPDMERRKASLGEFYGGPVWTAHRDAANATMIDSDDVLLLQPAWEAAGFDLTGMRRPARPSTGPASPGPSGGGLFTATIWHVKADGEDEFVSRFREQALPILASFETPAIAAFVTDHAENTFPRLPVRAKENVFVSFARFRDATAQEAHQKALMASPQWRDFLAQARNLLSKPTGLLRLAPTARSRLR